MVCRDAELADGVVVGAYAVVHAGFRLAEGVRVDAHAVLGGDPRDLSFTGEATWLDVGRDTVIREAAILVGDLYLAGIPVHLLDVTAHLTGHADAVRVAGLLAG
ncbi:MAG: hypothetical protein ABW215_23850 [Kibdelosporangium sp.]